jgi:hypothetical protein
VLAGKPNKLPRRHGGPRSDGRVVKHASPWPRASAGPSLPVHASRFRGQRCSKSGGAVLGASKPDGARTNAQASFQARNARRNGFSWMRARVSRSWLDASRSWRSVAGRQAGNARPSSKELRGNTPDGDRAARASEPVQGACTTVPKTACIARSARESSGFTEAGFGSNPKSKSVCGVGGLETNGVRARRSRSSGRRFGSWARESVTGDT